uniref:Uncharacterized protein n=1 Tax=Oryza glumipatula TaxID=40148 RepID=A0A0E0B6F5_9ORYZ
MAAGRGSGVVAATEEEGNGGGKAEVEQRWWKSIFDELESNGSLKLDVWNIIRERLSTGAGVFQPLAFRVSNNRFDKKAVIDVPTDIILGALVYAIINILTMFCFLGPFVSIGLSAWRLRKRDYGTSNGEASLANLTPALDFFYTLVICQGVLYYFLTSLVSLEDAVVRLFYKLCKFPEEWGRRSVANYLQDTREKCTRDPVLAEGRSLLSYAIGLLDSESQEEYLSGARMLDILINDGEDASTNILRSRPKIQRLLDKVGWRRSCSNTESESESGDKDAEIRTLSARIVADVAGGIQLAQLPGAIWSISSLLETTGQPLWYNINQHELSPAETSTQERDRMRADDMVKLFPEKFKLVVECVLRKVEEVSRMPRIMLYSLQERMLLVHILPTRKKAETGRSQGAGDDVKQNEVVNSRQEIGGCNELILQGFRILERLASDPHNCRDICDTPGLLVKITAPLYSATLIQDIANNVSWAGVVNESLRALQRLIHVGPGTSLRHDILSDKQAMSNLESILHLRCEAAEGVCQELQMQAIEILTQLVLHSSSANIISETRIMSLVKKQLEIFLPHGGEVTADNKSKSEAADNKRTLKATAGETLVSILSKCGTISMFIIKEHNDVIDRLTGMFGAKCNIRYRILSANILENLCTRCNEHVNETLLQKVLNYILKPPTTEASESTTSAPGGNVEIPKNNSQGNDVENQMQSSKENAQKTHAKASQGKKGDQKANVSSKNKDQQANVSSKKQDQQTNDSSKEEDQHANEDGKADMKELLEAQLSLTLVLREQLFRAESSTPVIQENDPDDEFVKKLRTILLILGLVRINTEDFRFPKSGVYTNINSILSHGCIRQSTDFPIWITSYVILIN